MFAPNDFSSWYEATISSANTPSARILILARSHSTIQRDDLAPVNGSFERRLPLPKEYRHITV
jgi:hypothetical protein